MRLPFALAATMAALALAPTAALASSDGPPLTESTSDCSAFPGGLACIPPIDESDLPHHIDEPGVPAGPDEPNLPDQPNSVCTARVNVNGATALGQLTNLKACPGTIGFNQGKLAMLQAGCNHAQDVIRLRYTVVSGGTTLRPEIGECLRGGAIVLTRDL
jgi:hypothetical protein